jgi:hypothetical protein
MVAKIATGEIDETKPIHNKNLAAVTDGGRGAARRVPIVSLLMGAIE